MRLRLLDCFLLERFLVLRRFLWPPPALAAAKVAASDFCAPEPAAGPEVSWVVKYGDILTESAKIVKKLAAKSPDKNGIYVKDSRILKTLPTAYVKHLERLILVLNKKKHTMSQKQRLIADILDNLAINFNITNSQIVKSFNMFKQQAKLKKYLKDK